MKANLYRLFILSKGIRNERRTEFEFTHIERLFWTSEGNCIPSSKMCPRSLPISRFSPPKCVSRSAFCMRKGAAKLAAPCAVTCLLFPCLSFRLSRFALSQPFPELPLSFFAFVVGQDVGQDTPGDVFDLVLRNTGIVYELLLAAQVCCSLRFDMKLLRCSCGWADDLLRMAWLPS